MSNAEYYARRAQDELRAAIRSSDKRARQVHLRLADAYSAKLLLTKSPGRNLARETQQRVASWSKRSPIN